MGHNILLVDDSSVIRKAMRRVFDVAGVEVATLREAENGAIALDALREAPADIVFLDINMPVMDGLQFMEAVAADAALKHTNVVVVSTEGSDERIGRLRELGVRAYLRKPVTPEGVVEVIRAILGGSNGNSANS